MHNGEGVPVGEDHPILTFVDREGPTDPGPRTLVVAPGAGAAAALRRGLTKRRGVVLGVDFVTAGGLARQILTLGGQPIRTDVPDPIEEREAVRRLLPKHGVGGYAGRFEGALAELTELLRELHTRGEVPAPPELGRSGAEVMTLASNADSCAQAILKGVRRNRAIVVVTGHAKVLAWLWRHFPWTVWLITRMAARRLRRRGRAVPT